VLTLAYDGSLNGDWVAHYAVRFAANGSGRRLRLLHVHEGPPAPHLAERIARIARECELAGVTLEAELAPRGASGVAERLLALLPPGATLVAGIRARPRDATLLVGTVTAQVIEARRCPVVALRVVHPGVLGQPGSVLLPVEAGSRDARRALPLLRLLGPDLHRLHLLVVRELSRLRLRLLSRAGARRLVAEGRGLLAPLEEELREGLAPHPFRLDSSVVVADDAPREIVLHASRHRSRLICLGTPPRPLARHGGAVERVLRDAPADVAVYGGLD
jgi:nucleotide-binding universal stress UspA family protein